MNLNNRYEFFWKCKLDGRRVKDFRMKNMKKPYLCISTIFFAIFGGWLFINDARPSDAIATYDFEQDHPQLAQHLHCGNFCCGYLDPSEQVHPEYAFQRIATLARSGTRCGRFEVRQGDCWRDPNKNRAELSEESFFAQRGESVWYGFSVLIPEDFVDKDNWLLVTQWHSYPDKELGEVWRHPILAARFINGIFSFTISYSKTGDPVHETIDDPDIVSNMTILELPVFMKGAWHDFVVHLRWSYDSEGLVQIWKNAELIKTYQGPVGFNDKRGVFWKFGLYRKNHPVTDVLYLDEMRRGESYSQVLPGPNGPVILVDPAGSCGGNSPCFSSIQEAVNNAVTWSTLKIAQGTYTESISLDAAKSVTLQGGWDQSFSAQIPNSTVIKAPRVNLGSLTLQNVIIKP